MAEHLESTRNQLVGTLELVAANHVDVGPTGAELEAARELGRRRATQGLSLVDVIKSFHLGSRGLFRALVESASRATNRDALRVGGMVWDLVRAGTTAVAAGHNKAVPAPTRRCGQTGKPDYWKCSTERGVHRQDSRDRSRARL